jgi:hypothetical protein
MATPLSFRRLPARTDAIAERLDKLRRRHDELSDGRATNAHDVEMARRRATNAAVMSAGAHDRLVERYEAAAIAEPHNADAHHSAANAHRSASDADLRWAFERS